MSLPQEIQQSMATNGKTWNFSTGPKLPNVEDVKMTLDKMRQQLYDDEEATLIEVGGVIMIKRPTEKTTHYDTYLHLGDYQYDH